MKKITAIALLMFVTASLHAQSLTLAGVNQCDVMYVTVYAYNISTNALVGVTNPIPVAPMSNRNVSAPWPTGFWSTDPSGCHCSWEFRTADVSRDPACGAFAGSGSACGTYDITTVTPPGSASNCFEISVNCGTCNMGDHVSVNSAGGNAFDLSINN